MLIDANIARSVANPGGDDLARACLSLLKAIDKRTEIRLLVTPKVAAEWQQHQSRYFRTWLTSMTSKRRIVKERDEALAEFRRAVTRVDDTGIQKAILKDAHLSEAALFYRTPVASRDDRQARYLLLLSRDYDPVGNIQWFHPQADDWLPWMENGCYDPDFCKIRDIK